MNIRYRLPFLILFVTTICFGCASIEDDFYIDEIDTEILQEDEPYLGSVDTSYTVVLPDEEPYDCPTDAADTQVDDPTRVICIDEDDSFATLSGEELFDGDRTMIVDLLELFPDYMRENVVLVSFSSLPSSEGVASMNALYEDNSHWEMWINTNPDLEETYEDWVDTLAHELMHYISLSPTVVNLEDESCGITYEASGYCPIDGSFFAEYIRLFWEPIYGEWTTENYNEYYDANPDDFVTPYAVSEPAEDIAETFAKFVFRERPTDISTIKEQKIDFFWQSEAFVSMRSDIQDAYRE